MEYGGSENDPSGGWGGYEGSEVPVSVFGGSMVEAMREAMRGRAAPYGTRMGFGPSPLDPMSAGLGRRGIAPPNWGGFDTQQGYGNFQGLNPNWGDWDQQQANVGALKGLGPWSNVRSRFDPMSGGSINRAFVQPEYNEGGM